MLEKNPVNKIVANIVRKRLFLLFKRNKLVALIKNSLKSNYVRKRIYVIIMTNIVRKTIFLIFLIFYKI